MNQGRLVGEVVAVAQLAERDVEAMFGLHAVLYDRVTVGDFLRDLEEKDWVLLLRDPGGGAIHGYTTILLTEIAIHGEPLRVVFSGDTGIDRAFWGSQALVRTWARFMGELGALAPERRLFWFLISKGYRTYLYLPLFFHRFYPRAGAPTPPFERDLITALGRLRYPGDFNPATGIVEFAESHGHLRPALADVPAHRRRHPHVAFFLEKNPGWLRGHELVCVAELSAGNMKGLAGRVLEGGRRALVPAP